MIGKTILHYKILEEIGRGGMGVVYKAEDTKLNREVAIKILPPHLLVTEDDRARFNREAKAAAALNHSNIATVHEINEFEGQPFIVMEYVAGKTLNDMLKSEKLMPVKDAINIATQVAEGLKAAHNKGIVHRDIKTSNILVSTENQAKILDFGLAKTSMSTRLTQMGTTIGTVAYMSPEQVQGKEVDHRTDLWSLGVVLYEMIAGRLPFKAEYDQAIFYSIQNEESEPLTSIRTGVPMSLEWIVSKLMAKDAGERYQSAADLIIDLKAVDLNESGFSRISKTATKINAPTKATDTQLKIPVKYSYKTILSIATVVILSIILGWLLKPGPPPPKPERPNKIVIESPENAPIFLSGYNRMAISPDGKDIVYLAIPDDGIRLFLKRAANFNVMDLKGTIGARAPFFSQDGRWIGYVNQRTNELYKILVDGGEPLKVASDIPRLASATWAPANTIIYGGEVLKRIPESGGEPMILTKIKRPGEQHLFPHMLPDGKTVLFTVGYQNAELNTYRLATYSFGDEDYQIILDEEGYNAVYSSTGHILYGRSNRLMAVPFDLNDLKVTGVPAPVINNVQTSDYGSMSYALSKEGTIIYVPASGQEEDLYSILNVDLSGQATRFFDLQKGFEHARYSPNGKYVAFRIHQGADVNIWIYNVEGGSLNQLTFYKGDAVGGFAWSPDSKTLAYGTMAEDSTNSMYLKRIDGAGTAEKIYTSSLHAPIGVADWSGDGKLITFDQIVDSSNFNYDLFVYSFRDSSAKPFLATPTLEVGANFSPNGKWLLYMSMESGTAEIYVRPYPEGTGGVWKISNNGGEKAVWSPDEKKIYYESNNVMYSVEVDSRNVFSKGNPRKIFEGNYFLPYGRHFDMNADGDKFIMIQRPEVPPEQQKIFVIQNFDEELKRLVPVEEN